jgi:hypothetical protein
MPKILIYILRGWITIVILCLVYFTVTEPSEKRLSIETYVDALRSDIRKLDHLDKTARLLSSKEYVSLMDKYMSEYVGKDRQAEIREHYLNVVNDSLYTIDKRRSGIVKYSYETYLEIVDLLNSKNYRSLKYLIGSLKLQLAPFKRGED